MLHTKCDYYAFQLSREGTRQGIFTYYNLYYPDTPFWKKQTKNATYAIKQKNSGSIDLYALGEYI